MKSQRFSSYDNRSKKLASKQYLRKISKNPTPRDIDAFLPWLCYNLQVTNVTVTRKNEPQYIPYGSKRSKDSPLSTKSRSPRSTIAKLNIIKKGYTENDIAGLIKSGINIQDNIPVTTLYDKRRNLVEIAVIGCHFPIHRKLIQAINVCLPFHSKLSKLSIRKGGLTHPVLREIGKLLPHSNITDVCLDDSSIPGGTYSVLLEQLSQLKYLSLKRCSINDDECKLIASKLDVNGSAVKHLILLDLTSNVIMDKGANALGEALKSNRHLLHLNLSGNGLSDTGAASILKYLMEFPLTHDDIKGKWYRKLNYLKSKALLYKICLEDTNIACCNKDAQNREPLTDIPRNINKNKNILPIIVEEKSLEDIADKKVEELVGTFEDPFNEGYIKRKDNLVYAIGNLSLSSLNLAYNNITLFPIKMLLKVLKYQSGIDKTNQGTGLLRVVIEGNRISPCKELKEVEICLKRVLQEHKSTT